MSTSSRPTAASRGCIIITGLLAASATAVDAQHLALPRFQSATRPPTLAIPRAAHRTPLPMQATRVPLPRIALSAALGGAVGGVAGGAAGAAAGRMLGEGDEYFSPAVVLGVLGLTVGYPIGAAVGARKGATVDGARPSLPPLILVSAMGAGVGGFVWSLVDEVFESRGMASRYLGGLAGFATHLALTSLMAQRAPTAPAPPVEPAGDPDV